MVGVIVAFHVRREHSLGIAPYLILLACPLMHVFGHGRHGNGVGSDAAHRGTDGRGHDHDAAIVDVRGAGRVPVDAAPQCAPRTNHHRHTGRPTRCLLNPDHPVHKSCI